jgi:two-component system NtrC family response regulator
MTETVLVVDDEPNYRLIIGQVLENEGWRVLEAGGGREAFAIFLERPELALVLTDVTMPDGDGLELLTWVKAERPEVPVVLLTAHNDVKLAVEAMRKGGFDYLTKPFANDDLVRSVTKALEVSTLARQNMQLRAELSALDNYGQLVGRSRGMRDLFSLLDRVAPSRANVLITGESGTGKELAARAIHLRSPRVERSFVAVNCSALTESLLMSELFGHEKGAYTGAGSARAGRFELAHQGTLFLDEIGELGQSVQVALLRALQERTIERVGGGGALIEVDVRLITATNRDLMTEVAAGRFREDLFYRLNVVKINIPPLRERLDDLPLLVEAFLEKHGRDRRPRPTVSKETMRHMYAHHWPGNVRELENVIERALVMVEGDEISPSDLPEELVRPGLTADVEPQEDAIAVGSSLSSALRIDEKDRLGGDWMGKVLTMLPAGSGLNEALSALEEGLLRRAMSAANGVQSRAADSLRLRRNVFKYKWDNFVGREPDPLASSLAEEAPEVSDLRKLLAEFEEEALRRALAAAGGARSQAADALGIKRNMMIYKLKKYPGLLGDA